MDWECVIYEKANRVATITLNRPDKMNALGGTLGQELGLALEDANADDGVGALVITGAGKGFCSGADLTTLAGTAGQVARGLSSRSPAAGGIRSFARQMQAFEKPSIAAVNGAAVGAGLSMALACDIRIASDRARFSQIFVRRGLVPDTGSTYFLPRTVGMSRACEMIFTGDFVDAAQALDIGLVSRVVPHDDLMREANDLAVRIAAGPTVANKLAKRALYRSITGDLDDALELEGYFQGICFGTDEFKEGMAAFAEKRTAKLHGK